MGEFATAVSDEELKEKDEFKFVEHDLQDQIFAGEDEPKRRDRLSGTIHAGKFEIMSVLGQGGMSTVYKARHLLLDRVVALKVTAFPGSIRLANLLS